MFNQTPTLPTAVHAVRAQRLASLAAILPTITEGSTWTSYHANPNQVVPFNDLTNNIPSWYGMHPVYGRCENFPVTLAHTIIDKELFLACCHTPWERKQYNHFVSQFPQFTYEMVNHRTILEYYHRIVDYARPRGMFVPPLCTLRLGHQFGIWFTELLPHIQHEVETIFTGLLATGLNNRLTGTLGKHRVLAGIIGNTSNGYEALFLMAQFAGHPLLNTSTSTLREPRQTNDQTVQEYIGDWIYYLYHQSLSGTFLSDRYFVQQFVTGLHSKIQFRLGDAFENAVNQYSRTAALPASFHPLQLSMTLRDRASQIKCLRLLDLPPREFLKPPHSQVRQINIEEPCLDDSAMVTAAVTSTDRSAGRQCLMCHSPEHLFNDCPKVSDLDSTTRRVLFSSLLKARSSTSHTSRVPSNTLKRANVQRVHAVTSDDGQSPFDETAIDSTALELDDVSLAEIENHPDFQ